MRKQKNATNIFQDVDWITVLLYFVLVIIGWMNIYAAVYNEQHYIITDISQKYGKQLIWIITAFLLAFIILIIDENFYTAFPYLIFGVFLAANIAVPFLGREVKGSRSWFRFGDFGIQPAEFMKFATNLALAKFLSNQEIKIADYKKSLVGGGGKTWLIEQINTIAEDTDFGIVSILPDAPKKVGEALERVAVRIDAESNYHELGEFVSRLESLELYLKIQNVEILAAHTQNLEATSMPTPATSVGGARPRQSQSLYKISMSVAVFSSAAVAH